MPYHATSADGGKVQQAGVLQCMWLMCIAINQIESLIMSTEKYFQSVKFLIQLTRKVLVLSCAVRTSQYIHRCVRLIREKLHQHSDDEFQEKFINILLIWLQKEVLPGFSGSDSTKRTRNPFINVENSKEAFALNQKGKLDKVQYGLKAFLISLVIHKVVELAQILRLVLVPLFPRLVSRTLSCFDYSVLYF